MNLDGVSRKKVWAACYRVTGCAADADEIEPPVQVADVPRGRRLPVTDDEAVLAAQQPPAEVREP